jgi:hypothetical protein
MSRKRALPRGLRPLGWLLLATGCLVLAWQVAAEAVEPRLWLDVADWLQPPPSPGEAPTAGGTSVRLYPDTRPHIGKIAGLQKGLVWVVQGEEVVEEGYGWGCPLVESGGRAYVSRHAETTVERQGDAVRLTKRYTMDAVDTPPQFLQLKFRPVPSLGVVTVHYDVHLDGVIDVAVDFSGLTGPWEQAYLMNEQGGERFTHYRDTDGRDLAAAEIGIWQPVAAARACFDSADGRFSFCVEPLEPVTLYMGRERYNLYNWRGVTELSWSGLDLEVPGPRQGYHYRIVLEAR